MTACAGCHRPLSDQERSSALRSGTENYHLPCAPTALLDAASEEYQAILRKGVRYFVEKYSFTSAATRDAGSHFVTLGLAVEAERTRRLGR